MPYLELNSGEHFFYRDFGSGETTVVLLHGFGNTSTLWVPFAAIYRRKYRFLIPDLPGFGLSQNSPPSHDDILSLYSDCVEKLIEKSLRRRVLLAGFSLGAVTSLQLAARGGFDRIGAYLHVDHTPYAVSTGGWEGGIHPVLFSLFGQLAQVVRSNPTWKELPLAQLPEAAAKIYFEILERLGEYSLTGSGKRWLNRMFHHAPFLRDKALYRAAWPWACEIILRYQAGDFDFRESIRDIKIPVTLVGGVRSELFNFKAIELMHDHIRNAKLIRFERSGHDLMWNEPLHFVRVFGDFLAASAALA